MPNAALQSRRAGEPIRKLRYPWVRWRSTLRKMKARYCEAYAARTEGAQESDVETIRLTA